ncbi:MAG: hypothetical protein ACM3JH_03050 [Acidithiobacillales bacterium]
MVILAGPAESPRAVKREDVSLTSPAVPATAQPFHEVMELAWAEAVAKARITEAVIEGVARSLLERLVGDARSAGLEVRKIGVVGLPDRDLSAIGNPHIRAHAAEGILFRRVLETAAEEKGLPHVSLAETGLEARAASELGVSPQAVRTGLTAFGQSLGRPWRADERAAATAAWLALAGRTGGAGPGRDVTRRPISASFRESSRFPCRRRP